MLGQMKDLIEKTLDLSFVNTSVRERPTLSEMNDDCYKHRSSFLSLFISSIVYPAGD